MIQEFIVTSLAFIFSSSPMVTVDQQATPLQDTIQVAMESFQEGVENMSTLSQLQNSLIGSLSVPGEKLFTSEQDELILKVKEEIYTREANGQMDQAIVLDTSLTAMLNAYGVAKGSPDVEQSTLSNSVLTPTAIAQGKKEATDHLLQARTAFVESVDTLPSEQIERIESELMLAEQMLITISEDGGNESWSVLKRIEQYIYHASFLLRT